MSLIKVYINLILSFIPKAQNVLNYYLMAEKSIIHTNFGISTNKVCEVDTPKFLQN